MSIDSATRILQIIANPVRKSIIQSLKGTSMIFSEVMRMCGLNPNYDTGPFFYHLSKLLDSGIIEKKGSEYQLTSFGNIIANFIDSLQRESSFLLNTEKPKKRGERKMKKIEARWLSQQDIENGEYGIIARYTKPPPKSEEEWTTHPEFRNWVRSLPLLDIPPPGFFGHTLGFEKNGIKLGSIHVRFCLRQQTQEATAQIVAIYTIDNNYQKIGETRASVLHRMMEEFLSQAKEHHTQSIEIEVNAEDKDLVKILKELGFKRFLTTYIMRTTIPS